MGISRQITERQLQQAKDDLAAQSEQLKAAKVADAQFSRSPKWRSASAKVKQIAARLRKLTSIEVQNAELERHKAERLAAAAEAAKLPKQKKVKDKPKAKAAAQPKAEATKGKKKA